MVATLGFIGVAENAYFEVFTKQKHICPNRSSNARPTTATRPTYYNKKPWSNTQQPKMSNSFELLTGPTVETVKQRYEILSDIVSEYNGKVHGSQRDRDPKTGLLDLLVYYEVSLGNREEVKQRFKNYILTVKSS